jgi:hypothetical protein
VAGREILDTTEVEGKTLRLPRLPVRRETPPTVQVGADGWRLPALGQDNAGFGLPEAQSA